MAKANPNCEHAVWESSSIQSVWFRGKPGIKTKRDVDRWLKAHKKPPSIKLDYTEWGIRARLKEPSTCDCFRLSKWMDEGRVRLLFCGVLPARYRGGARRGGKVASGVLVVKPRQMTPRRAR